MAAASSSLAFFGSNSREENQNQLMSSLQQPSPASSTAPISTTTPTAPPPKKRRNQPGNPTDPDAEVIALSPKTLMATNRFICEVCNKGFQREQNLQLHRRGHNLPWKLKQKTNKEPKRKVYLCPEPTCVHHDPSRALGDLTGIKKHFSRKHGEKKWKCEKCSKRYAVQSDWKAHSKTCGTREYRCDCGTLFSRRDSFITHRAFCDALAQESARHPSSLSAMATSSHLYPGNNQMMSLGLSQMGGGSSLPPNNMLRLGTNGAGGAAKFEHLMNPSSFGQAQPIPNSSTTFFNQGFQDQQHSLNGPYAANKSLHGLMQLPDLQSNTPSNNSPSSTTTAAGSLFNLGFFSSNNSDHHQFSDGNGGTQGTTLFPNGMADHIGSGLPSSLFGNSLQHENMNGAHMSATALLQKAAQMGSTTSPESSSLLRGLAGSTSSSTRAVAKSISGRQLVSSNSTIGGVSFSRESSSGGEHEQHMRSQQQHVENENHHLQGLIMNSLTNGNSSAASIFGSAGDHHNNFGTHGFANGSTTRVSLMDQQQHNNTNFSNVDEAKLTLDFLGVGGIVRNMGGGGGGYEHRGINMSSLDPELKSSQQPSQPYGGTSALQ
ncbi:protein indeterminate-domain 4, chloroplastic-like isoform X1 [Rosa rugosa]|uniref:protein indeterminate-domain 4, chloroplastic-like isoform X1 n=2 Tax=Rosa rugosa TaxID=74645 RepID=UPI002B406A2D|nr:protein indeterminate-domain 4, chloroplastic-like isoform X1 [Rosa rugosa]